MNHCCAFNSKTAYISQLDFVIYQNVKNTWLTFNTPSTFITRLLRLYDESFEGAFVTIHAIPRLHSLKIHFSCGRYAMMTDFCTSRELINWKSTNESQFILYSILNVICSVKLTGRIEEPGQNVVSQWNQLVIKTRRYISPAATKSTLKFAFSEILPLTYNQLCYLYVGEWIEMLRVPSLFFRSNATSKWSKCSHQMGGVVERGRSTVNIINMMIW